MIPFSPTYSFHMELSYTFMVTNEEIVSGLWLRIRNTYHKNELILQSEGTLALQLPFHLLLSSVIFRFIIYFKWSIIKGIYLTKILLITWHRSPRSWSTFEFNDLQFSSIITWCFATDRSTSRFMYVFVWSLETCYSLTDQVYSV